MTSRATLDAKKFMDGSWFLDIHIKVFSTVPLSNFNFKILHLKLLGSTSGMRCTQPMSPRAGMSFKYQDVTAISLLSQSCS